MGQITESIEHFVAYWKLAKVVNGGQKEITKAVEAFCPGMEYLALERK